MFKPGTRGGMFTYLIVFFAVAVLMTAGSSLATESSETQLPRKGTVIGKQSASVYVYLEVEGADKNIFWMAAPRFEVKTGDVIEILSGEFFEKKKSIHLNRELTNFYGVSHLLLNGEEKSWRVHSQAMGDAVNLTRKAKRSTQPPVPGTVEKADGGHTAGELISRSFEFSGKNVKMRGKIVSTIEAQGVYWLKVMDGTEPNPITVVLVKTDVAGFEEGEIVEVTGTLNTEWESTQMHNKGVLIEAVTIK